MGSADDDLVAATELRQLKDRVRVCGNSSGYCGGKTWRSRSLRGARPGTGKKTDLAVTLTGAGKKFGYSRIVY
jgi:hypothetical protein